MSGARYPNISDATLKALLAAEPAGTMTPELVARATGDAANFAAIVADLERAGMLHDDHELTPLADAYVRMWRTHLDRS